VLKYYTTKVNKSIIDGFKQQVSEAHSENIL